jgi:hypothetical protein
MNQYRERYQYAEYKRGNHPPNRNLIERAFEISSIALMVELI